MTSSTRNSFAGGLKNGIYPIICAVPEKRQHLTGKDKVQFLSSYARHALRISADMAGLALNKIEKDANGVPLPWQGIYWSLSHKASFVASVAALQPIGIDVEQLKPCSQALMDRAASAEEWALVNKRSDIMFFRFWTAKEAILKAAGTGFKDFSKCHVTAVSDHNHLTVAYRQRQWRIEHYYFNDHIASIVKIDIPIHWKLLPALI
ncbi:MAG: 4'-phosphopantetheinyl transferase superfamily protein [Desulfobacterales bacterium]|nr:4'-phosphopantetheinyl transferase superfamily protein [Desulfobacterales bacterium]MDJ0915245.1 4'-phosphopantetheinyl transferase superfamily protein [Desulfobacterales bacterium]